MKKTKVIIGLLCAFATTTVKANLISNGDFSLGNSGFSSGYINSPSITDAGTYTVTSNPRQNHPNALSMTTPGGGNMLAVNGAIIPGSGMFFWGETITTTAGSTYELSLEAASWSMSGPYANPYDSSPASIGVYVNGAFAGGFSTAISSGQWNTYNISFTTNQSISWIALYDLNTASTGNDFAISNLNLTEKRTRVVPEPNSLSLLLITTITALIYRRRNMATSSTSLKK